MASNVFPIIQILILAGVIAVFITAIVVFIKRSKLQGLLVLILLLAIMAITNPTKSDYTSWVKEEAMGTVTDDFSKAAVALFGDPVIGAATKTTNCIFFSIFESKIDKDVSTTVGFCKQFIPID